MQLLIFIALFLYICNRQQTRSFIEGFINRKKQKKKDLTDPYILNLIKSKTGVQLSKIVVIKTDEVWGMMAGIWPKPYMILTEDVLNSLNNDELEWVLLHEAGHYVLWHAIKSALIQFLLLVLGTIIITNIQSVIPALILAITLSIILPIIYFQIARNLEREANNYALERIDNPKGMITVAEKAKQRWVKKGIALKGLQQRLFNIWIYDLYIEQAKKAQMKLSQS